MPVSTRKASSGEKMFQVTTLPWINRRFTSVLFLGFFSGLPLFLTSSTLQAWFATAGVSVKQIGLLGLVGTPYLFKFLWAPILDRYVPPLLGRRRGWILLAQIGLVVALLCIARLSPESHALLMGVVALCIAFFSATQDIAINAYQTELLLPAERGTGAALGIFGYRIAMLISGGMALIFADRWGWQATYTFMAMIMLLGLIVAWYSPAAAEEKPAATLASAIIDPLKEFMSRDRALLILLGILLYELGSNFVTGLNSTFFIRELHFSLTTVGAAYKVVGFAATVVGLFTGGYLLSKLGLFRSLILFGVVQALASFLYVALALAGKNYGMMLAAVTGEYLGMGLGTAALLAWLMSLCDHRYTATQFALFSALASVGRVLTLPVSGYLVSVMGWPLFFVWGAIAAIPGLLLIVCLKSTFSDEPRQA